jgi:hypothetical protein
MRLNKYEFVWSGEPAGKFDLARLAGSKGAVICKQHYVICDKNLKKMSFTIASMYGDKY